MSRRIKVGGLVHLAYPGVMFPNTTWCDLYLAEGSQVFEVPDAVTCMACMACISQ